MCNSPDQAARANTIERVALIKLDFAFLASFADWNGFKAWSAKNAKGAKLIGRPDSPAHATLPDANRRCILIRTELRVLGVLRGLERLQRTVREGLKMNP